MTREDVLTSIKLRYDLSSREMDVLNLLVDGATNTEISSKLFISENTVKFHVSNLLKKTGTKSRKELSSVFLESFSKK
ncbi:MAG: LuxR C-terminal-related transcriptional regulator [Saccharofermentans sp.]|nr:LuxR C-terminal-related transcriptional regulator [Saccharofermentans sp.]